MLVCLELVLAFSSDLWHLPISTFSVAVLVGSCFLLLLYCICFTYPRSSAMDITLYRQYEIYRKPCSVTALETAIRWVVVCFVLGCTASLWSLVQGVHSIEKVLVLQKTANFSFIIIICFAYYWNSLHWLLWVWLVCYWHTYSQGSQEQ